MANIDTAFRVEGLSLNDKVGIFNGSIDPSVTGFSAPTGSLFLRESGEVWKKVAASDTSWIELGAGGGGFAVVTSFLNLPSTPIVNDMVFYTPFNSVVHYDGTHWVGPKITIPLFGRSGKIEASFWLNGLGKSKVFFSPPNRIGGYVFASIGGNGAYKFYNICSNNQESITGSIQVHDNSQIPVPSFPSTGIIQASHSNSLTAVFEDSAGIFVSNNAILQCFFNRVSGKVREIVVTVTYSLVAG